MFPNLNAEQARQSLSNQEMAVIIGVSRRSFEKKKKDGKFVLSEIKKLCSHFGKSFEYLFETKKQN